MSASAIQIVKKRLSDGTIKEYRYPRNRPTKPEKKAAYSARVYKLRLADYIEKAMEMAARRAKERGFDFALTPGHLEEVIAAQHERCAMTDLKFDLAPMFGERAHNIGPYRPSIDRVDARLGYIDGNVRIVCFAVNAALGEWGDATFLTIAAAAVQKAIATSLHLTAVNSENQPPSTLK